MEYREPPTQNPIAGQKSLVLNPTIPKPVAPEIEDEIILTISEVDRQTADQYFDTENCLICTALRNRGFNVQKVGGSFASLETHKDYVFMDGIIGGGDLSFNYLTDQAPFYGPEVVGKVIRLRKVNP